VNQVQATTTLTITEMNCLVPISGKEVSIHNIKIYHQEGELVPDGHGEPVSPAWCRFSETGPGESLLSKSLRFLLGCIFSRLSLLVQNRLK
jgi:hypothetical protein